MPTNETKPGISRGFVILLLGIVCGPLLHGLLIRRGVPHVAVAAVVGVLWGAAAWASQKLSGMRVHGVAVLLAAVGGAAGSLLASSI